MSRAQARPRRGGMVKEGVGGMAAQKAQKRGVQTKRSCHQHNVKNYSEH